MRIGMRESSHFKERREVDMKDQILHVGFDGAARFVGEFCAGKQIVLVTDGQAYSLSGAANFFDPLLPGAKRLVVKTANPKVNEVQDLLTEMEYSRDLAFIAVGGGTSTDTAKLLNFAISTRSTIRELMSKKECPELMPFLAVPTTAGTGAEATRFAVCYDGETKHSIDFPEIRPSHVLVLPELTASLPPYQKASTNFDAYAQAVESLWARGATEESKSYANRAFELMKADNWPEASYWAGRAIDISRTTAAHAFSYYLTSHYGIPHGHAVYMVFPYICRNNGRKEWIKVVPELKSMRDFAGERGIGWNDLIEELFAHVNLKRLGNNPVEVKKESFYE